MGILNDYGTQWGNIPQTAGRVFWVAPGAGGYTVAGKTYRASDDNDGLSPERAFATPDRGVNLADQTGDVVVLLPGAHTATASLAMDTAGVTLTGLPSGKGSRMQPRTSLTTSASDEIVNITADNVEIAHLEIIPVTAQTAIDGPALAVLAGVYIHDCYFNFNSPAASTGTIGIDLGLIASRCLIEDCTWECDGAQGPAITGGMSDSYISRCLFTLSGGTWASAITISASTQQLLIQDCSFLAGNATITAGINGAAANQTSGVHVHGCVFADSVTVAVDGFGAGEAELAENYQAGVGSTDGGVLITAIT